jgi:hypothetical protein
LGSLEVHHLGLDAAREAAKKVKDVEFEPANKALDGPKEGEHDDKEHSGGDTYAGGVSFIYGELNGLFNSLVRPEAVVLPV